MGPKIRRELWLALIVFPVALAIGWLVEFVARPEWVEAATTYQRTFMNDLTQFTPVTFVGHIWHSVERAIADLLAEASGNGTGKGAGFSIITTVPFATVGTIFGVIGSVWQNETLLASILVTLSFVVGFLVGFSVFVERVTSWSLFALIPAAGVVYLVGTITCSILWGVTWLGLILFGWLTNFAGFCFLCGAPVSVAYFVGVQYIGFRTAHEAEKRLGPGDHGDQDSGKA